MLQAKDHIRSLDGLRGVAALIVVFSHFSGLTGWLNYWPGTLAAHIGVMIFFVLSGFLMGYLTIDQPISFFSLGEFMRRRVARVVPVYLFVVLLSFFLYETQPWWKLRLYGVNHSNIINHLLFIKGESVLWTIPVEIQFYLIFAIILWPISAGLGRAAWILTSVCIILFKFYPYVLWKATGIALFSHAIAFFLSGLLISQTYTYLRRLPSWIWDVTFIIAAAAVPLLYPRVFMALTGNMVGFDPSAIAGYIYTSKLYIFVCAILVASTALSPIAQKVLGNRALVWCGAISFSLYLWHMPVLWMLNRFTVLKLQPWLFLYNALPLVFLAAWLSYRFIEKPARRWINQLGNQPNKRLQPAT